MISRVAENCFWLNRYVERVEVLSRMLGVNLAFQLDVTLADAERWHPLVVVTGQEEHFLETASASNLDEAEKVQEYLTWDDENPSSLISSLRFARDNARTIRETISLEMWEALNDLWVWMQERAARREYAKDRHAFYLRMRNQCLLFHGLAQATMLHEDPLEFMRLGTALERASQTARILDIKHHSVGPTTPGVETPHEVAQWVATLRFCSGIEPFLKRGDRAMSGREVADFLIFEERFPRSVIHNLLRAKNFLGLVRPSADMKGVDMSIGAPTQKLLDAQIAELAALNIDTVLEQGLHEVLTSLVEGTAAVCESLTTDFFAPPAPAVAQTQTQTQTQTETKADTGASA